MCVNETVQVWHKTLGHLADIHVGKDGKARLTRFSDLSKIWLAEDMDKFDNWFASFIQRRVFPNNKDEMTAMMLKELGLPYYDPIEICKRTNGRKPEDGLCLIWLDKM